MIGTIVTNCEQWEWHSYIFFQFKSKLNAEESLNIRKDINITNLPNDPHVFPSFNSSRVRK